jgi:hypothetical protein
MRYIFLSIKDDATTYAAGKLKARLAYAEGDTTLSPQTVEAYTAKAISQIKSPPPRIASREEFYQTNKDQVLQIGIAERCATQQLVESAPLLDGEEIKEDFFSYLTEPVDGIPANTGVLRRTTNMAEILYIFDFVRIDNGTLVHVPPPPADEPRRRLQLGGLSFTITTDMIKKLLKTAGTKAATAGLNKLGSIVLSIVMKELGMENDTEKMLDEIRKVIKEELDASAIDKIEGIVNGTMQFMSVEYKNQKAKLDLSKVENRKILMADLKTYSNRFYTDVIGTLKQERYAVKGLKTFMFAAPVHMLLTQEMALIDPERMDPNESGFLQTLRENATIYRNHVQNAYNKAMNERNNMEVYCEQFVDSMGSSTIQKQTWWWRDNVTGQRAGEFMSTKKPEKSARDNASESLERHRNEVLNKRREELGKPQETFLDIIGDLQNFSFPKS